MFEMEGSPLFFHVISEFINCTVRCLLEQLSQFEDKNPHIKKCAVVNKSYKVTHLLRTELLRGWKILSIIVSEMVVADNGDRFDSCIDKKIYQNWLQFGLSWFEVITSDKNIVFLC